VRPARRDGAYAVAGRAVWSLSIAAANADKGNVMGNLVLQLKRHETIVLTAKSNGMEIARIDYIPCTDNGIPHCVGIAACQEVKIYREKKQKGANSYGRTNATVTGA